MHLPNLFAKGSSDPVFTQFFAIHIGETEVRAALWRVGGGIIETLSTSQPQSWHDENDCVAAIDRALQELGETSEVVSETLFALPSEWVNAEGILASKKPFFQRLTKELSLKAVGFVVTTEACVQHLAQTISPQLSIFFIEVLSQQLVVSLVKQGQLKRTEKTGRSGDAVSDLTEAFAHFTEKPFPGKMLLFSTTLAPEELQEIRQSLFQHDWAKAYEFLQPPVIDLYPSDNVMEMIVHTGGQAVAQARGLMKAASPLPGHTETEGVTLTPPEAAEEQGKEEKKLPEKDKSVPHSSSADELSLLGGEEAMLADNFTAVSPDVLKPPIEKEKNITPEEETAWPDERTTSLVKPPLHSSSTMKNDDRLEPMENDELDRNEMTVSQGGWLRHHLRFVMLGVTLGIVLLLGGAFIAASQLTQANVQVNLDTKTVSKSVDLTLDPQAAASDAEKKVLKAELVTHDFDGDQTMDTTGTKIIGDKAAGKVMIYNLTSSTKLFPAGAKLTSGKLAFTLDQATTVASASTSTSSSYTKEVKPGTVEAAVTAAQIGSDSNIDKDVELVFDGFSKDTFVAKTTAALAGGTSREIRAIAKEDRAKLLMDLQKKIMADADKQFKTDSTNGKYFVGTGRTKVIKTEYSGEAGKEANSVSLKAKIQVEAMVYQSAELRPLAAAVLASEVPEGYKLSGDPQILSTPTQAASGSAKLVLQTSLSATAVPVVDPQSWLTQIGGKSVPEAKTILEKQTAVKEAIISLTPFPLILLNGHLPTSTSRLHITTNFP